MVVPYERGADVIKMMIMNHNKKSPYVSMQGQQV